MGACCGKKPPALPPVTSPPAQQRPAPVPASSSLITLYKHLPGTRQVMYFNTKDRVAFNLGVSIPFKFHKNCGVAVSSKLKPN